MFFYPTRPNRIQYHIVVMQDMISFLCFSLLFFRPKPARFPVILASFPGASELAWTLAIDKTVISCTIVYMKIISDTNIFLAVVLNEPEKDRIIQLTSGADVVAPEILPYEIGNALSAMYKRKQITNKEALSAQRATGNISVRLVAIDIQEALRLAIEFNIYAYDAYFLQCAKSLSSPLITLDNRMKQVAAELNIDLLE